MDDTRAAERSCERGYIGGFDGDDAYAARGEIFLYPTCTLANKVPPYPPRPPKNRIKT